MAAIPGVTDRRAIQIELQKAREAAEQAVQGSSSEASSSSDHATAVLWRGRVACDLFQHPRADQRRLETESHIHQHFVAGDEGILYAHMALVRLLSWEPSADERPRWRQLLHNERVTANVADFSSALAKALKEKIVSHIFHQQPASFPQFLNASLER